jgi:GTP-binding protein Era
MRAHSLAAIADADVILHLVDATARNSADLVSEAKLERTPKAPIVTAYTKIDLVDDDRKGFLLGERPDSVAISAVSGEGLEALFDRLSAHLPESPFLYSEEDVSTHSVRSIAAEYIREAALEQLQEEVPHSVACVVEEFREGAEPVYIRAIIYAERESQKGILVGARGSRIREIGRAARQRIEALVGSPVYLDLRVKVLPNWRRDKVALRRLGLLQSED